MKHIILPFKVKVPVLACGADLKGAFALAKGSSAFLFDGFGDLGELDNYTRYEKAVKDAVRKSGIRPRIIACDLHPEYFSTRFAEDYTLSAKRYTLYRTQHHQAHIASAIVDNSIKGDVIGVAFDGTGYGSDGNIWGGEFFVGGLRRLERAAHLEYIPMPGAEAAIKEPWRMAVSYLYNAFRNDFPKLNMDFLKTFRKRGQAPFVVKMIERRINSPLTSSAGRLFDAVGSIILAKERSAYEAEIPMELERIASRGSREAYRHTIKRGECDVVSCGLATKGVLKDLRSGVERSVIAAKLHNMVADIVTKVSLRLRRTHGINKVALSGGVFQNALLTGRTSAMLKEKGFKVHVNSKIPTNDSGIPIGQVAIANGRAVCV